MGVFWRGIPDFLVESSANLLGPNAVAIETGTYLGDSAALLGQIFSECHTIELDEILAENAIHRFSNNPSIKVIQGTTREVFPKLLNETDKPLFIWLDAHYSGGVTAGEQDKCPVLAEINAIQQFRNPSNTVVLIDDARGFLGQNDWPFLSDLLRAFDNPDWIVASIDDVLIATSRANCAHLLKDSYTNSRLFSLERYAGRWAVIKLTLNVISPMVKIAAITFRFIVLPRKLRRTR
jgi:hypothetical protein